MFMEMVVGCLLVLILLLVQYYTITIAFRPVMAGNLQYTNFSQYYYDIEILLSTGSNLLTSKSSGAKQWSKLKRTETRGLRHLAAEFPKQCVYRRTREKKKGLAFCSLL